MRLAMADPTDTTTIAEFESLTQCEMDVSALPLSAIDELVVISYRQINTAVVQRVTVRGKDGAPLAVSNYPDSEVSVTAQIPLQVLSSSVETRKRAVWLSPVPPPKKSM